MPPSIVKNSTIWPQNAFRRWEWMYISEQTAIIYIRNTNWLAGNRNIAFTAQYELNFRA